MFTSTYLYVDIENCVFQSGIYIVSIPQIKDDALLDSTDTEQNAARDHEGQENIEDP